MWQYYSYPFDLIVEKLSLGAVDLEVDILETDSFGDEGVASFNADSVGACNLLLSF